MKLTKEIQKKILSKLWILALICIVYYIVTWFTGCPIRYFLGISCPGCGMTRAWLSILHLDFAHAFHCHPLFLLAPFIAAAFVFDDWIDFKKYRWLILLVGVIFVLVYLVRMIWFPSEIIAFEPENGLIGHIMTNVFHFFNDLKH
ncbi:MAG: DUF2752 domain-containing protein [Clostridia bacterium]|nr:DUF2752 domain-containing protein [Clostridia bacterium]NCC42461.1 DUF2752 domain-containing protein [Clostridia bacterium]